MDGLGKKGWGRSPAFAVERITLKRIHNHEAIRVIGRWEVKEVEPAVAIS